MQSTSASYRSYAIDFWGFGETAKEPELYSMADQVELVHAFMEKLGIGRVALIGHGLGGLVSLLFAKLFPDQIDRVMAISSPSKIDNIDDRLRTTPEDQLGKWMVNSTPGSEMPIEGMNKVDFVAIQTALEEIGEIDLSNLISVDHPCLFVQGTRDPGIHPPSWDWQATLPKNTHYIAFENSGHYPMLSEPVKFHRLLSTFLSLEQGQSPKQLQLKEEWKRRVR